MRHNANPNAHPNARTDWQRRASPLARYALAAYLLIVVDASLYPFAGWRDLGIGAFDYLSADWPLRPLPFDLFVNALGYAPLGFLGVLSLHPRIRGVASLALAVLLAAALSANLEALQTFLPTRVASKVDLLANAAGALIGAAIAVRVAHPLLDTGRLRIWRARWFGSDASRGLVLAGVWFGALVYPDLFAFGTGGVLKSLDPDLARNLAESAGLRDPGDGTAAARFQLAETIVSSLALTGAGLLFLLLLRDGLRWRTRLALLVGFLALTILAATLAHAFLFDDAGLWPPLTPGARLAVGVAAVVLVMTTLLPRSVGWALAIASLAGAVTLVNLYPDNPYVAVVGLTWTRGRLMNFYGLASGINLIWPWLAVIYLTRHRTSRMRPGGDRRSMRSL